jgi:hypothetical protein
MNELVADAKSACRVREVATTESIMACFFFAPFYRKQSLPLQKDVETGWKLFKYAAAISNTLSRLTRINEGLLVCSAPEAQPDNNGASTDWPLSCAEPLFGAVDEAIRTTFKHYILRRICQELDDVVYFGNPDSVDTSITIVLDD